MKKLRTLIILVVVMLIALVLLLLANNGVFKTGEHRTEYGTQALFDYDMDKVTALEWNYPGQHYRFNRSADGVWTYDGDPSLAIRQDHLQGMLIIHHQLLTTKAIDGVDDYGEYGIDLAEEPTATVWTGTVPYRLWIGGRTQITMDYIYVADQDGVVYVTDAYVRTAFEYTLEDTLDGGAEK